jgi:hypothetical protein
MASASADVEDFVAQYTTREFAVIRFVVLRRRNKRNHQAGATCYLERTSTGLDRSGSLTLPQRFFTLRRYSSA